MKNIENVKKLLIKEIENMTVEQHIKLNDMLCEDYDFDPKSVNKEIIFNCEDCSKIYGACADTERTDECDRRYVHFLNSEA